MSEATRLLRRLPRVVRGLIVRLLTPDDVATRTGLTREQVDRLIKSGKLRSQFRLQQRGTRVTLQDLTDYVLGVIQEANDD